ncbi:hypothetical protein CHS0354_004018 [Potamilus streckersoni]|uniref:Uncharacterized protein n=1 Tax=Potamilus streckersoni TaxID=2493646 RepID=A0AAE0S0W7_9BIVA|nr:hypothetical protein CHS0354_004018 [Potamilus streckersoni]
MKSFDRLTKLTGCGLNGLHGVRAPSHAMMDRRRGHATVPARHQNMAGTNVLETKPTTSHVTRENLVQLTLIKFVKLTRQPSWQGLTTALSTTTAAETICTWVDICWNVHTHNCLTTSPKDVTNFRMWSVVEDLNR